MLYHTLRSVQSSSPTNILGKTNGVRPNNKLQVKLNDGLMTLPYTSNQNGLKTRFLVDSRPDDKFSGWFLQL
jgi:hypothetical protein